MQFEVIGKVTGKARPKVTRHGVYTPKKTVEAEAKIRQAYREAGGTIIDGPVAVSVETFRALPKSRPKKLVSEPDTYKPDGDNVTKLVLDALNGVAYADDSQVVMLSCIKWPRTRCEEKMTVTVCPVKQKRVLQ